MMLPDINTTSSYQFTTEFTSLNGIYTLVELITYNQAIADGVNFVTSLYTPAGVAASRYTTDAPNYASDTVLVLKPMNSSSGGVTLYVPESVLAMVPDSMVGCYNNLALGISLGLFDDQTTLNWVISEINTILASALGIESPAVLYSLGSQYMKISDFQALVASRASAAAGYQTLYTQLQEQIAQNQSLKTLVSYYENTLVALNGSGG